MLLRMRGGMPMNEFKRMWNLKMRSMPVIAELEAENEDIYIQNNVASGAHLLNDESADVSAEIRELNPTAIIASAAGLKIVRDIGKFCSPLCVVVYFVSSDDLKSSALDIPRLSVVVGVNKKNAERMAFAEVERLLRPKPCQSINKITDGRSVIMVGAGIVNLVTALELIRFGFSVEFFDQMSDPFCRTPRQENLVGATFGGANARIFSLNESRQHLIHDAGRSAQNGRLFRNRISDSGWLSVDYESLYEEDKVWLANLESVPSWLADIYHRDILGFNVQSRDKWFEILSAFPTILRGVSFNHRLLRIYQREEAFLAAIRSEAALGACREILSVDSLVQLEPSLAESIHAGDISGALIVDGFSLCVKDFSRNIIRLLRSHGVRFHWDKALDSVEFDMNGRVDRLHFGSNMKRASHVVMSPGAYSNSLSKSTRHVNDIASVAGMWVTIPNEGEPLTRPVKVKRRGFASSTSAEGANMIPGYSSDGCPVIFCSSGHGFVGVSPARAKQSDLMELARCVKETAGQIFPDKFRMAERRGMLDRSPEFCVRPWTYSGLGIFQRRDTVCGGKFIVTGGHNTGSFAQAPMVAEAVRMAVQGKSHAMDQLYHPKRPQALVGRFE